MKRIAVLMIVMVTMMTMLACGKVSELKNDLEGASQELSQIAEATEAVVEVAENLENFEGPDVEVGVFDDLELKAYSEAYDWTEYAQMSLNETYVGWGNDFKVKKVEYFDCCEAMLEKYADIFVDADNTSFDEGGYVAVTAELKGTYKDDYPAKITGYVSVESDVDNRIWSYSQDIKEDLSQPLQNIGDTVVLTAIYGLGDYAEDYVIIKGNAYTNGGYPQYIMKFDLN